MSFNRENGVNAEQIASFLADAVSRVEGASDAEIQDLNEIKKLFKKNVPFSRRKYVAALLIKQASGRGRFNRDRNDRFNRDRNERNERFNRERNERTERTERAPRTEGERTERAPRVQLDPALSTSIFIGIGRNRRVYPRDLVQLLVSVAGIDRERIGDIKVLANYSFIQLFTEDCEKVISALNGYDYRGRTLSVSYSRQKEESESASENTSAAAENTASAEVSNDVNEEAIPANVTNDAHAVPSENAESARIAQEQSAFAAQQAPFSETSDDGQVRSHFGDGAAY